MKSLIQALRSKKAPKQRYKGLITLDMFNIDIPIYISDQDRVDDFQKYGLEVHQVDKPFFGLAGWTTDENDLRYFYVVLSPTSQPSTWVHEASHLVDFIIDYLGLDPSVDGTETRAYMLGHIFGSIEHVMTPIREHHLSQTQP